MAALRCATPNPRRQPPNLELLHSKIGRPARNNLSPQNVVATVKRNVLRGSRSRKVGA